MKLKCETDSPEIEREIKDYLPRLEVYFEHGQWWVTLGDLGTWAVVDTDQGLDFEQT